MTDIAGAARSPLDAVLADHAARGREQGGGRDDEGKLIEFSVKAGDVVLISKYGGTEVKIDGEEHLILSESDILGIINK